jgi:hypothetical protein
MQGLAFIGECPVFYPETDGSFRETGSIASLPVWASPDNWKHPLHSRVFSRTAAWNV